MVRIKDSYPDREMAGVEASILEDKNLSDDSVLLGFPLDSELGWYDSAYITGYRCWWISRDYVEYITTIVRSKFK